MTGKKDNISNEEMIEELKYLDDMEKKAHEIEKTFKNFPNAMAIVGFLIVRLKFNAPKEVNVIKDLKEFSESLEKMNKQVDNDRMKNKIIPLNKKILFKEFKKKLDKINPENNNKKG